MTTRTQLKAIAVSPILTVNDLSASIRFYEKLGFEMEEQYERDGRFTGGRLRAGEARINLSQDDWAKGRNRVKGVGMRIFLPVEQDIDELAMMVKTAGLKIDRGPEDVHWGRAFMLTDPDGFPITVARVNG